MKFIRILCILMLLLIIIPTIGITINDDRTQLYNDNYENEIIFDTIENTEQRLYYENQLKVINDADDVEIQSQLVHSDYELESTHDKSKEKIQIDGVTGTLAELTYLKDCSDSALVYIGCDIWKDSYSSNSLEGITVIIDVGMSIENWLYIEDIFDVNIDYMYYDTNTFRIKVATEQNQLTDDEVGYDPSIPSFDHGYSVTSSFASVANGSHILFVNLNSFLTVNDIIGTRIFDTLYSDSSYILAAAGIKTEDIRVISMSYFVSPEKLNEANYVNLDVEATNAIIENMTRENGVFFVVAIGNDGQETGDWWPIYLDSVYSVGSIDHEDLETTVVDNTKLLNKFTGTSSVKDQFTGNSEMALEYPDKCKNPDELPFCSSWGYNNNANYPYSNSTDFLMPGNGVPVLVTSDNYVEYVSGTSYSAPYLAAAAYIGVSSLIKNINSYNPNAFAIIQSEPKLLESLQLSNNVYNLLKSVASRTKNSEGYNYQYGWGYVKVNEVFDAGLSYDMIYNDLIDLDGDQMSDIWEVKFGIDYQNNADKNYDPDQDQLTNIEEYNLGTNPTNDDTDSDSIDDGYENSYSFLNPLDPNDANLDQDNDNLSNSYEYFILTNPDSGDTDSDGMGDYFETLYLFLDPKDPSDATEDEDTDGLSNLGEFENGLDPLNPDWDSDDMKDGFEVQYNLNPKNSNDRDTDVDNDGATNYQEYLAQTNPQSDDYPPTVSITSHSDQEYVSGIVIINVNAYDLNGISTVKFYIDNLFISQTDPNTDYYRFTWDTSIEGSFEIKIIAYDNNNNFNTVIITLIVDNSNPVLDVSVDYSGSYGSYFSGMITFTVTASDLSGIDVVNFYVDETYYGSDYTSVYSYSIDSNSLSDATHTFLVRVYDNSGSYTDYTLIKIVDNIAPTGNVYLYSTPSNYVAGTNRDFYTSSIIDEGVGIDKVWFYIDEIYHHTDYTSSYRWYNLESTLYSDGLHKIKASFVDKVGNVYEKEITFIIDNNDPTGSVSGITNNGEYTIGTTISISVSATDTGTGVINVRFYSNSVLVHTDSSASYGYSFTFSGTTQIRVVITDGAGRTKSWNYNIYQRTAGGGGGYN